MTNREIVAAESGAEFTPAEEVEEFVAELNRLYAEIYNTTDFKNLQDGND